MEQHFLSSYYHAILSVILAQFSARGCSDGMEGIVQLVKASPYLKVRACIKARKALVQSMQSMGAKHWGDSFRASTPHQHKMPSVQM